MNQPNLRVVPSPTADAMAALGETTIAGVLGSYERNLDERERAFHALLQEEVRDPETWAVESRELFKVWRAAERRLDLYRLLANEVES